MSVVLHLYICLFVSKRDKRNCDLCETPTYLRFDKICDNICDNLCDNTCDICGNLLAKNCGQIR